MTRRFIMRPRVGGLIAGGAGSAFLTVMLLYLATHGPVGDRVFWLVLAAITLACAGIAMTMVVRRPAKELVLTDKAIILANVAIRFEEVRMVIHDKRFYGYQALEVLSASQKLTIDKSHLRPGAFDEIHALVKTRCKSINV